MNAKVFRCVRTGRAIRAVTSSRAGRPFSSQAQSSVVADENEGHRAESEKQTTSKKLKQSPNKTVETAAGLLPMSPLMDPTFHEARERWEQPKRAERTTKEKVKWRRILERNPYAQALATPCRRCLVTRTVLPNAFLQRFTLVSHPETGDPWWYPQDIDPIVTTEPPSSAELEQEAPGTIDDDGGPSKSSRSAPGQSAYVLPLQDLFRDFRRTSLWKHSDRALVSMMMSKPGSAAAARRAVWRDDMAEVYLDLLRQKVVERLAYYARMVVEQGRRYVTRCDTWEEVKELDHRGCLLWLGGHQARKTEDEEAEKQTPTAGNAESTPELAQLSTMDTGARYGKKLAVHNLRLLLGDNHLARLKEEASLFGESSLFLLGRSRTLDVQLQLWKLQNYLSYS